MGSNPTRAFVFTSLHDKALEPDGKATACKAVNSGFDSHRRLLVQAKSKQAAKSQKAFTESFWVYTQGFSHPIAPQSLPAWANAGTSDSANQIAKEILKHSDLPDQLTLLAKQDRGTPLMRQTMPIGVAVVFGITVASLVIVKSP